MEGTIAEPLSSSLLSYPSSRGLDYIRSDRHIQGFQMLYSRMLLASLTHAGSWQQEKYEQWLVHSPTRPENRNYMESPKHAEKCVVEENGHIRERDEEGRSERGHGKTGKERGGRGMDRRGREKEKLGVRDHK